MYSLNASVPSAVAALATDVAADLPAATPRTRGGHTLGVKRLGGGDHAAYARYEAAVRDALTGVAPFAVRVPGVRVFEEVPVGSAPVVYLRVESPGLVAVHERLCERFDPVPDIEGDDYTPHVTVARGGNLDRARAAAAREVEPVEWTVEELVFWDATREATVSRLSLPA
ncbi:MAG: 2'-5' RNA ligase family protein [Halorientalis sp.]